MRPAPRFLHPLGTLNQPAGGRPHVVPRDMFRPIKSSIIDEEGLEPSHASITEIQATQTRGSKSYSSKFHHPAMCDNIAVTPYSPECVLYTLCTHIYSNEHELSVSVVKSMSDIVHKAGKVI